MKANVLNTFSGWLLKVGNEATEQISNTSNDTMKTPDNMILITEDGSNDGETTKNHRANLWTGHQPVNR